MRVSPALLSLVMISKHPINENGPDIYNWSKTHKCRPRNFITPESEQEIVHLLKQAHESGTKIRCMGSGLSPNGLGFSNDVLISMENMNKVLELDVVNKTVTVETGILVGDLLEVLHETGLTLQNLASINQQQIGGFIQVGAHGTGASIPPVEEQVLDMRLVTPALGVLDLSPIKNSECFQMAKCGLGALGVVTQVTLQCVSAHKLKQVTTVHDSDSLIASEPEHMNRLRENRHVRYMWVPHANKVVVVSSNMVEGVESTSPHPKGDTSAMVKLLNSEQNVSQMSVADLRDKLLHHNPLSTEYLKQVNTSEAAYWSSLDSSLVCDDSANILGFDCGGEQLVLEIVVPCGTLASPTGVDLKFMEKLLEQVDGFPSPSPIEQRWTCGSSASMSPAHSVHPEDKLYSWIGIIMYLPDDQQREAISAKFKEYVQVLENVSSHFEGVQVHWAKLEVPETPQELKSLKYKLAQHYPLEKFREYRDLLDPKRCLSNSFLESLFED